MSLRKFTILNLGAGVQSAAIHGLMADGEIEPATVSIFSDTKGEPSWVYDQLEILKGIGGPPTVEVSAGDLADDLVHGRNSTGQRFASIPAHTTYQEGVKGGMTRRQCTREYKIEPIEKWVRQELLGLKPKQRIPQDVRLTSLFGFSTDDGRRAISMQRSFSGRARWSCDFPLMWDSLLMTRQDCVNYCNERFDREWRSSRCVYCPLQGNRHWKEIKDHDPDGFAHAVHMDEKLRAEGSVANRDMREIMYLHKSCRPLSKANLCPVEFRPCTKSSARSPAETSTVGGPPIPFRISS